MLFKNRIYTAQCRDGMEIRLYETQNGNYEICTGIPGAYFSTEMIFDNLGDAYRAYNDRIMAR